MNAPIEVFRIVCAWCNAVESEGPPNARVSHTICAACAAQLFAVLAEEAA